MEAYFDNSATTRCYDEVREIMDLTMLRDYGNPSSMHRKGVESEKYIREAARTLAGILKADAREIYFTSGGTESDNWALFGTAMARGRRGKHIIISSIEHPAVSAPAAALEEMGYEVTRLSVEKDGRISLNELEEAIREDTILVSLMAVNNEIGTVEPVREAGELIKKKNPSCYFHVDAIQAFGKLHVYPGRMNIDLMSASSHKIHGPKGVGFLYIGNKVKIRPLIFGGGQQNDMRSGTDNVPGIAGMAKAAEIVCGNMAENAEKMYTLKEHLADGLLKLGDVCIHGMSLREGAPHILNASFIGIRSEVLLHALEDKGIYVSAGSACSTHKRTGSPTLTAIGCSKKEMESAVRFSFSEENTIGQVDYTLEVLNEIVPMLRRYTRR